MVALELAVLRYLMLPHVIRDLVAARRASLDRTRVELTDAARHKERRLHAVRVEQLDEPPGAHAAAKLSLGELLGRLVVETRKQHGVEIGGEVDGDAVAIGPSDRSNPREGSSIGPMGRDEIGDLVF
jgi:hypothetical protein